MCTLPKGRILCSHIVRTLIQLNRYTLPEKYFIDRWRPIEKKHIGNTATNIPAELRGGGTNTLLYNLLSRKFVEVISNGCMNLERCNRMLQGLESLHDEIKMIPVRNQITSISITDEEIVLNNGNNNEQDGSNNQNSEASIIRTNESTRQVAQQASMQIVSGTSQVQQSFDTMKNPDVVPRKRRPRKNIPKSKRWIPTSELVRTK